MSRISARSARAAVASGLVLAAFAPAVASAAPATTTSKIVRSYDVNVQPGILANGNTVHATAVIRNPQASVKDWYSQGAIARVVRKGINGRYEMPYTSQGFRITPSVNGQSVSFTGRLRGGDVATTIKLTFTARYAG